MRSFVASIIVIAVSVTPVLSQDQVKVAQSLQANSVTIHSGRGQGSGVVVKRGDRHYILTAAHVIANLRQTQEVIENGGKRIKVVFEDARIVTELYEGAESVGETSLRAEVLRYSNADDGEDLALLRVRKRGILNDGVKFFQGSEVPGVGTELLHCGSLMGQFGSNSIVPGIVSQIGRVYETKLYDQTNANIFPGSSGGGIFRKNDGLYVGMIVRGAQGGFGLYVPIRRVNSWANKVGVAFILNEKLAVPTDEELRKQPIEEPGTGATRRNEKYQD